MIMIREPLPGRYELAKAYDTSDVDRANAEMRKTDPWSPLRGLRRAASIPVEDLRRLSLGGIWTPRRPSPGTTELSEG